MEPGSEEHCNSRYIECSILFLARLTDSRYLRLDLRTAGVIGHQRDVCSDLVAFPILRVCIMSKVESLSKRHILTETEDLMQISEFVAYVKHEVQLSSYNNSFAFKYIDLVKFVMVLVLSFQGYFSCSLWFVAGHSLLCWEYVPVVAAQHPVGMCIFLNTTEL